MTTSVPSPLAPLRSSLESEESEGLCCHDDSGATAVEYALLVALIAAVIVAIVATLGLGVRDLFDAVNFPG